MNNKNQNLYELFNIKNQDMYELSINSNKDKGFYIVLDKVTELLSQYDISFKVTSQIELIIEEIYLNIVKHAYGDKNGLIKIKYSISNNPLKFNIIFIDNGPKFNPLKKESPNLSDNIDDREIGGLGIHLVKELSDEIKYENINNQNVLAICKYLEI